MPAAPQAPQQKTSGFKISVVDENGIKSAELFSDIGHLKFETAKGGKPLSRVIAPSSKEEPIILKTEERHMFMT